MLLPLVYQQLTLSVGAKTVATVRGSYSLATTGSSLARIMRLQKYVREGCKHTTVFKSNVSALASMLDDEI